MESVKFTIDDTNKIQKINMKDKVVSMSKTDIGGNEVEGAKIQIIDKDGKTIENTYEVMIAFKTIAYSNTGFRYYAYTDFENYEEYEKIVENFRKLEFYYTGVVGTYQDKYITLSTCEYSQKNGRMVVVGKKI